MVTRVSTIRHGAIRPVAVALPMIVALGCVACGAGEARPTEPPAPGAPQSSVQSSGAAGADETTGAPASQTGPVETTGAPASESGPLERAPRTGPRIRVGELVVVRGQEEPHRAVRVVRGAFVDYRTCYEDALARTPGLEARITARITVDVEGHVTELTITERASADDELVACTSGALSRLTFASAPQRPSVFEVPFGFFPR